MRIEVDGRIRRASVHLPRGYDGQTELPVVIMLHGGGATGRSAALETGWTAVADREQFLAVFPNALPLDPNQLGSFPGNPQLWNDGSRRFHDDGRLPDDLTFLDRLLDKLLAEFAVDPRRVFLTGFSNGASLAFRAGATLAERITAIAPVAGSCWVEPIELRRPVPLCYITGLDDPLNPIEGGLSQVLFGDIERVRSTPKPPVREKIRRWAEAVGCPADTHTITEFDGVCRECYGPGREDARIVCITISGLGHVWPGGRSLLPESIVGPRSDKIRATDVIWDFFATCPPRGGVEHPQTT